MRKEKCKKDFLEDSDFYISALLPLHRDGPTYI